MTTALSWKVPANAKSSGSFAEGWFAFWESQERTPGKNLGLSTEHLPGWTCSASAVCMCEMEHLSQVFSQGGHLCLETHFTRPLRNIYWLWKYYQMGGLWSKDFQVLGYCKKENSSMTWRCSKVYWRWGEGIVEKAVVSLSRVGEKGLYFKGPL
jgi:hypothetical protein